MAIFFVFYAIRSLFRFFNTMKASFYRILLTFAADYEYQDETYISMVVAIGVSADAVTVVFAYS